MSKLIESQIIGKSISDVLSRVHELPNNIFITDVVGVLDTGLILQLLPYGLRPLNRVPAGATADRTADAQRCLDGKITSVITDSNFYPAASEEADLRNPPYDDVYVILDRGLWMANRFFENGENSLTVGTLDDLRDLSEHYYDYWSRNEIRFDSIGSMSSSGG